MNPYFAPDNFRGIERSFVIIEQKMVVFGFPAGRERRGQQSFGENDSRSHPGAVRTTTTFTDAVESVAGRDNPSVGGGPFQIPAEVFKDRGIFRRHRSKVVKFFIHAGGQAGRCNIVPKNSPIDYLGKKSSLGDELSEKVGNIFVAFQHENFFVTRATSKRDNDGLSTVRQSQSTQRSRAQQSTGGTRAGRRAKEVTAAPGYCACHFPRIMKASA